MVPRKTTPTTTGTSQTPRGGRTLRTRIIVLSLSLIAGLMAVFVTNADAQCPPPKGFRYIGGTCYFTGSVRIDAEVNHTADPQKKPKSFHGLIKTEEDGILYCGNMGGNQPKGQRIIPVKAILECDEPVEDVDSPKDGGTAHVVCEAQADLQSLDQYCTPGQIAFAFVPCAFTSKLVYMDDQKDTEIEAVSHRCELSSCQTLGWDRINKRPEQRLYDQCGEPMEVPK